MHFRNAAACLLVTALVAAVMGATAAPEPAGGKPIERIAWLAGCWERASATRVTHEQWMAPLGGTMLGMSRTVREGRLAEFEHVRIERRDSVLVYTAKPSGQDEASFRQTVLTDTSVVFSNPSHDFPKVIRYTLRGDSLLAQIAGTEGGEMRVVDFHYRRVPCPGR